MTPEQIILNRFCDLQGTNFIVTDVKVTESQILWQIEHKDRPVFICPKCKSENFHSHDYRWITLRDYPFGPRKNYWRIKQHRILCSCSLFVQIEELPFKAIHHRLTKRCVKYIERVLCSKMFTVADTARLFELNYGVVYKIDHEVLLRLVQNLKIPDPIHISVDEKSFQKGHSYVTIIIDTDTGDVIWVTKGNSKESLDEFFRMLGAERCKKILTVSKDLHSPYAASCKEYIPKAIEVADPFHVVQRLNHAIDDCRQELSVASKLSSKKRKRIYNMHWILRYKQENLQKGQLESLEILQKINEPLYKAYLHKEVFYQFFEFSPREVKQAHDFLIQWIVEAFKIGLYSLTEFAEYLKRHTHLLLNIIRTRRNSAISEGINTKISVIKQMAYGYKNIQYFMLKIMQRCGVLGSLYNQNI
jgi:transposase